MENRVIGFSCLAIFYCLSALAQDPSGASPPTPSAACGPRSDRVGTIERENSGFLDKNCVEETRKADECCRKPDQEKCGYKGSNFGQRPQGEEERRISGIYQPAVNQSRDLTASYNRNAAFASLCRTQNDKRKRVCAEAAAKAEKVHEDLAAKPDAPLEARTTAMQARLASRSYSESGDQDFEQYRRCHQTQADQNLLDLQSSLAAANAAQGEFDGSWKVACTQSMVGDQKTPQCYIQNTGENTGDIVSGPARDNLPVKAVPLSTGCTGFTDERGNLTSASHCTGPDATISDRRTDPSGSPETALWRKQQELPFDDSKFRDGSPWNDKNHYTPDSRFPIPEQFKGKPFYHLAQDTSLASGCEARGNILACSPEALKNIQGTQAEIQGFPADHFRGNPVLKSENDVLVTRGPAYYDPYSNSVRTNAYSSGGNSGGPAYFREGTEIGGFKADRPVIFGAVTGGQSTIDTVTGKPVDGSVYVYSNRTNIVPIASVEDTQRLLIPQVQNNILRQGGSVFVTPTVGSGKKRRR